MSAVKITMRFETTVENFFKNDGDADFVDKISVFLGIKFEDIRIVNARDGKILRELVENSNDIPNGAMEVVTYINSNNSNDTRSYAENEAEIKNISKLLSEGLDKNNLTFGFKLLDY